MAVLAMGDYLFEEVETILLALVILAVGVGVAYIGALFLAAFGELVETNTKIKESNEQILHIMQHQNPAVDAPSQAAAAAAYAASQVFEDGSWKCTCGRRNMGYTSTCACGKNKRDIL